MPRGAMRACTLGMASSKLPEDTIEDASEEPAIEEEEEGPSSTVKAKAATPKGSGKGKQKQKEKPSTWDPEIVADDSLANRPGLSQFLEFRELKKPAGLTFDLSTLSLSVSPSFSQDLHYHKPTHHKARPWVEKAVMQRAVKWKGLDIVDKTRISSPDKTMNRTARRHRGNVFAQPGLLYSAACSIQKHYHQPSFVRWARNVAPTLPERLYGHLDGIVPEDVDIYVEDHRSYLPDHPERIASCIWVAINAPWGVSMRACEALASGEQPHPDWDILTPVLKNFHTWLHLTYHKQKPNAREYRKTCSRNPRRYLPLLRDMMPPGHDIPVVFAFRQKYMLFVLKGGIDGKLVAQYASHWLPIKGGSKADMDVEINQLQLTRLREGAAEDTRAKSSGGIGGDPEWMDPGDFTASLLHVQPDEVKKDERNSRKKTKPPAPKGKQTRPSLMEREMKRMEQVLMGNE
ncbi:hypothetical protein VMCG_04041 [Cytospora schulzeri]|uniref:Uncharacterized protein n=1 Tax=Cytospora schulzeri TaxID=448051 RepID=A0A423WU45_9PEZI|nr:hypothetical protein VMCG_04041 [Valsa malicola]